MAENLSDKQIDDMYAATLATVWDHLPKKFREETYRNLAANEVNEVAIAVQHGRRVIRENKKKSK
jgi:hypothetical protein